MTIPSTWSLRSYKKKQTCQSDHYDCGVFEFYISMYGKYIYCCRISSYCFIFIYTRTTTSFNAEQNLYSWNIILPYAMNFQYVGDQ